MLPNIVAIQSRESLTDGRMAALLGLSRPQWNLIRNGRRPLTDAVAMRAVGAFPELTRDLLARAADSVSTPANTDKEAA